MIFKEKHKEMMTSYLNIPSQNFYLLQERSLVLLPNAFVHYLTLVLFQSQPVSNTLSRGKVSRAKVSRAKESDCEADRIQFSIFSSFCRVRCLSSSQPFLVFLETTDNREKDLKLSFMPFSGDSWIIDSFRGWTSN